MDEAPNQRWGFRWLAMPTLVLLWKVIGFLNHKYDQKKQIVWKLFSFTDKKVLITLPPWLEFKLFVWFIVLSQYLLSLTLSFLCLSFVHFLIDFLSFVAESRTRNEIEVAGMIAVGLDMVWPFLPIVVTNQSRKMAVDARIGPNRTFPSSLTLPCPLLIRHLPSSGMIHWFF